MFCSASFAKTSEISWLSISKSALPSLVVATGNQTVYNAIFLLYLEKTRELHFAEKIL